LFLVLIVEVYVLIVYSIEKGSTINAEPFRVDVVICCYFIPFTSSDGERRRLFDTEQALSKR